MKTVNDILKESTLTSASQVVEYQHVMGEFLKLEQPMLACDILCKSCNGSEHTTWRMESTKDSPHIWFCNNPHCELLKHKMTSTQENIPRTVKRMTEWPLFCEMNDIGDMNHDVRFESIRQSPERIYYFTNFANKPTSFMLLHGDTGNGKTYAAMGICELYMRTNKSAMFVTQARMTERWLESLKDPCNIYVNRLKVVELLVIDDFGTAEMTSNFLKFMLDLVNSRMQWNGRGTIITTNLSIKKFSEYCGDALIDRINTGVQMEFKGESRRKPNIL